MRNPQITVKPNRITIDVTQRETTIVQVGTQGPAGVSGEGGIYQLISVVDGVNAYSLSGVPASPHLSQLYLNGGKQQHGIDYVINASVLNWTSPLALNSLDLLEIYFR